MKNAILGILTSPLVSMFVCTVAACSAIALTVGGTWILLGLLGVPAGLGLNYLIRKIANK